VKILLVGNYEFDGSMSMKIWADTLHRELLRLGIDVKRIAPKPVLGRLKPSATGVGKWLGYFDRFILFPRQLRAAAATVDVVHICDHGGAMYKSHLKKKPVLVTCHDMLAVRGALGEVPEMRASLLGRWLQLWIRRGIQNADKVACVSHFTFNDVYRILNRRANLCVILNGLNYPYQQLPDEEVDRRLAGLKDINRPFVLHVGSNHARKNRDGVLRVFSKVAERMDMQLVFAGEALTQNLIQLACRLQIQDRIVQVRKPDTRIIEILYNRAVALLFPSRYEGFGWPSIEAQACGCPVVVSGIPPLIEVVGQSGIVKSLEDEDGMAEALHKLATNNEFREEMRKRGLENVRSRFHTSRMMEEYMALYKELSMQNRASIGSKNVSGW
jgi:glycosyltransferase involved in cell wall biosynthesis